MSGLITTWHIITGEYPPQQGGVSDYSQLVARRLAEAGDIVHVWSPPCSESSKDDCGVHVHRLPNNFGPRSLRALDKALAELPKPTRLLVQYVPHAFGWKALNLQFCIWLWSRRRDSIWIVFHEVAFPLNWKQSPLHNFLGLGTRLMAWFAAHAAERIFVSTESWKPIIRSLGSGEKLVEWLAIPSSISIVPDDKGAKALRHRYAPDGSFIIGHFGTYGAHISALLMETLPRILLEDTNRVVVLLGSGGERFRDKLIGRYPDLAIRLIASGTLSSDELSRHLQAVDLMLQPYPDGVSTRRTSIMACLQHGVPTVTTIGQLTEPFWSETNAVLLTPVGDTIVTAKVVQNLQDDLERRTQVGELASALYEDRFAARHAIATLRGDATSPLTRASNS